LNSTLYNVSPREQVGSRTGNLFEFQYHQAAAGALELLHSGDVVCVYCEWHDDYVTEWNHQQPYVFHQVKTRSRTQGVWKWPEFFGVGKMLKGGKRKLTTDNSSIFLNLWDHTQKFGTKCQRFVFVSDAELEVDFQSLLNEAKAGNDRSSLGDTSKEIFDGLLSAIEAAPARVPGGDSNSLFAFLRSLHFTKAVGSVSNVDDIKLLLSGRILDASEVDLTTSDARKIGGDLVTAVKIRSHLVLSTLPASTGELQQLKGIVIKDLLRLLSLSEEGYAVLQSGDVHSVKTLSRFRRLCERNKVPLSLIPDLCDFKVKWTAWWTRQKAFVNATDFVTLKEACAQLLRAHSDGGLTFERMAEEAKVLASNFSSTFGSTEPLTADHIVGLILSLAVEAEA
jgi:hypothetical protein